MPLLASLKARMPWILGIGGICLAAALLTYLFIVPPLADLFTEPQGTIATQQRQGGGSKDSGLAITGWIERNRAPQGTPVRAWYRLTNVGSASISDLRLAFYAPGFVSAPVGGRPTTAFPIHRADRSHDQVLSSGVLWELPPGSSRTIWVEMVAIERSGDYMVTAAFSWTGPHGEARAETIELGPLRARSPRLELTASLKDFAISTAPILIPVLVLVLGFAFQNRQQQLVQQRQASAAMLPVSHQNNFNLYLPALSSIASFQSRTRRWENSQKAEDLRAAFFFLLLSVRAMREVDQKGGFYLTQRKGERLVTACWGDFAQAVLQHLTPYEDLSALVDAMEPSYSLSRFTRKLTNRIALQGMLIDLEIKFASWATSTVDLDILYIFWRLAEFEINRIYTFWYGTPEVFALQDCKPYLERLAQSETYAERVGEICAYLRSSLGWSERRQLATIRKVSARTLRVR